MRPARETKVGDLPLPERIVHFMLAEQEKQVTAHATMNEDIVRRGFEPTEHRPRVRVPSDKRLKAMPSEIKAAVKVLVGRGTLVLRPFGGDNYYEVVKADDER